MLYAYPGDKYFEKVFTLVVIAWPFRANTVKADKVDSRFDIAGLPVY